MSDRVETWYADGEYSREGVCYLNLASEPWIEGRSGDHPQKPERILLIREAGAPAAVRAAAWEAKYRELRTAYATAVNDFLGTYVDLSSRSLAAIEGRLDEARERLDAHVLGTPAVQPDVRTAFGAGWFACDPSADRESEEEAAFVDWRRALHVAQPDAPLSQRDVTVQFTPDAHDLARVLRWALNHVSVPLAELEELDAAHAILAKAEMGGLLPDGAQPQPQQEDE